MAGAWSETIASQVDAALQAIANAIQACPDALWAAGPPERSVSYLAYHALFWTDVHLFGAYTGFVPPPPFTLEEMDPAGILPAEPHTKPVLLGYVAHCRARARSTFASLDDAALAGRCAMERWHFSLGEMHLYNLRHIQHHAGQIQLLLRQGGVTPPGWVWRGADGGA